MTTTDVAVAGAGRMGVPMIRRLVKAGHRVSFYDPDPSAGGGLEALGAARAARPAQLGAAPISISVVTDGPALLDVLVGADGIARGAGDGHVHLSMGTVGPDTVRAAAAAATPVAVVDAPVSGSVTLALSGELTAIVGATDRDYERVVPILEELTRAQFRVGEVGAGSALKLAVNTLVAATNQAIGESLLLAEALGIARAAAYDVLLASVASSPYLHYKRAAFTDPATPVEGSIAMLGKDLDLALASAAGAGLDLPGVAFAAATLREAATAGLADRDVAALAEWIGARAATAEVAS
jgi:3-hydroxyisobutyrate dehydrogenase-like beta-hydroxyacid dehydrogenase